MIVPYHCPTSIMKKREHARPGVRLAILQREKCTKLS